MSAPTPGSRTTGNIFEIIGSAIKRPESMVDIRNQHPGLGSLIICIGALATSCMVTLAFDSVQLLLVPWVGGSCNAPSTCYSLIIAVLGILYFLFCPVLPAIVIKKSAPGISVKIHYVNLLASQSIHVPLWFIGPLLTFQLALQFPFQGRAFATVLWSIFFAVATFDTLFIAGKFFKLRGGSKIVGIVWAMLSSLVGGVVVIGTTFLLGGLS